MCSCAVRWVLYLLLDNALFIQWTLSMAGTKNHWSLWLLHFWPHRFFFSVFRSLFLSQRIAWNQIIEVVLWISHSPFVITFSHFPHTHKHTLRSLSRSFTFLPVHTHSAFLFWAPVPLRKIHQEAMTSAWSDNIMPLRQRANILRLKLNWAWKLIGDEWYRKRTSVPPSS